MSRVYLDHNATSPARPSVIETVNAAMQTIGNASAPHSEGRTASKWVEDTREKLAAALGATAQNIVFTSGGTESDNMAVHAAVTGGSQRLLISQMEHPAVSLSAEHSGVAVETIPCNLNGQTDMVWLEERLENWDAPDGPPFIAICAANSETGVIQDVARACELAKNAGGFCLVDAVQALGKMPIDFTPDYLSVSAHKIGGPMGIGAVYISPNAPFAAFMQGGGQERRKRAGTLNVAAIAGFGAALTDMTDLEHTREMRDTLETGLRAMESELTIFGGSVSRLPNTSYFAVPDHASSTLMMALDLAGISVSAGMACSSGKAQVSMALQAMDGAKLAPKGGLRVSLGYNSTAQDIEAFLSAWAKIRNKSDKKLDSLKGAA